MIKLTEMEIKILHQGTRNLREIIDLIVPTGIRQSERQHEVELIYHGWDEEVINLEELYSILTTTSLACFEALEYHDKEKVESRDEGIAGEESV